MEVLFFEFTRLSTVERALFESVPAGVYSAGNYIVAVGDIR
jgi:hypothetical protein